MLARFRKSRTWKILKLLGTLASCYVFYTGVSGRELVWKTGPGVIGKASRVAGDAMTSDTGRWVLVIVGLVILGLAWGPSAFANARTKVGQSTPTTPAVATPAVATPAVASKPDQRVFIDVTPEQLSGYFKDRTEIEGQRLVKPYLGKWMRLSEDIYNVSHRPEFKYVMVSLDINVHPWVYLTFDEKWLDQLELLPRGARIDAEGQIGSVSDGNVVLNNCELASGAEAKPAASAPQEPGEFVSSLPITTLEEAAELGKQCTATSKAIYAFLAKNANRTDEANVLAEYRQKFEATVLGVHLDLLAGGISAPDRLAIPAASLTDVHLIAVALAGKGEGFRADRLQKLLARAKDIEAKKGENL